MVVVKILRHRATDIGSRCLYLYSKAGKEYLPVLAELCSEIVYFKAGFDLGKLSKICLF